MHVKTDKNSKICDIHIEKWDNDALPPSLKQNTLSYLGLDETEFISFAFNYKLFLYTRILFILRDQKETLYLWSNSPIYGGDGLVSLNKVTRLLSEAKPRYATFACEFIKLGPHNYITAKDDALANAFRSNNLEIELTFIAPIGTSEDIFALFGLFNVVRNCKNSIQYMNRQLGTGKLELKQSTAGTHSYVVALTKNGALKAYTTTDILIAPREELREFQNFYLVAPNDEKQEKALETCRDLLENVVWEIRLEQYPPDKKINLRALKTGRKMCLDSIGNIHDLPIDLGNTIANYYYQLALTTIETGRPGFSPDGANLKNYFSKISQISSVIEVIPEYVRILRKCRTEEGIDEYKKIAEEMSYEIQYNVKIRGFSALRKFLIRRKKPTVEEIPLSQYF